MAHEYHGHNHYRDRRNATHDICPLQWTLSYDLPVCMMQAPSVALLCPVCMMQTPLVALLCPSA
jgi:hypothetical protein